MAIEKYLLPLIFAASLAGCADDNIADRRIYKQKSQYERKMQASNYSQPKSSDSYTAVSSTCTGRDEHSAIGITIIKLPGTPLGIDTEGNVGIRPGAMLDDDDSPGFGGIQINP